MAIVRKTLEEICNSITEAQLEEMKARRPKDEDIDFSDIPETDAEFWKNARIRFPDGTVIEPPLKKSK